MYRLWKLHVFVILVAALLTSNTANPKCLAQNAPVTATIDAASARHPINPNIYGTAYATTDNLLDLNSPFHRLGGNNTTRYNWQLNSDNRGADWYFESIPYASAIAGEAADTFILASQAGGAEAAFTIPIISWIAKVGANRTKLSSFSQIKYGAQKDADWNWFSDAGNGVLQSNNQWITGNDPKDANVSNSSLFQKGLIQHLITRFRVAGSGGLKYYLMDNEPSIWWATHRDVAPLGQTMNESRDTLLDYGSMIKSLDPNAQIMGPEEWGWSGYFYSGLDQRIGNTQGWGALPDRAAHGNWDYLPWLLDQMHQRDVATGKRVLDVFTVHFYPQGGEFSGDISNSMQLRRNRSTRALWDPSYVDETWIGTQVQLIPRLHNWINSFYPGTKLGITEYNWGADDHINGATTQADIYGIFGREGLDYSSRWTTPTNDQVTFKSMQIYRNYDRFGSNFGDTSVSAIVPNPDELSAFAAQRNYDGALTVMLVNKVLTGNTPVTVSLLNYQTSGMVQVRQLTSNNRIARLNNATIANSTLAITVPPQSVTLIVISPVPIFAPAVPSSVHVGAGVGQADLKWRPLANATSYTVKRSLSTGGPYVAVGSLLPSPAFTDFNLEAGTHYYYVVSSVNSFGESANSGEVTAVPLNVLRINSGGPAYISSNGGLWQSDELFDNGYSWQFSNNGVSGTSDPSLFWSARDGTSFSYHLPAQSGLYNLKLSFVDDKTASGQRTFNVSSNGVSLLSNFDIYAASGGAYKSIIKSFNINCDDNGIRLQFDGVIGSAMVSGIELTATSLTPPSPSGLNALAGNHSVLLTWTGTTRAAAYTVKRSLSIAGPYNNLSSTVDGAAFEDVTVTNGTTYYYKVAATNAGGSSVDSNAVSASPGMSPPVAPSAVTVTAGDRNLLLTWSNVSMTSSYSVKRALNSSGPYSTLATGLDGAAFQDVSLTNGTNYFYIINAVNTGGIGPDSPIASGKPIATVPGKVTSITLVPGDRNILLTWAGISGAASYSVKRSLNLAGPFTLLASGLDGAACQDVGLTNGTTYYYTIVAVNSGGNGPDSSSVIGIPIGMPPGMVTGVTATVGDRNVLLTWSGVTMTTSYTVRRSQISGGPYTTVGTGVDGAAFQDVGLVNGVTYYYIIQGVNSSGSGPASIEIAVTPHG